MTDIARHLNISQAMVSYVLSGRASGRVNELTRERVLKAAQEMGYRPNRAARALAGHGSRVIELCVNGFHPSYYGLVLEAFNLELRPTPYELHIVDLQSTGGDKWTASTGHWPVDGIIADIPLSETVLSSLVQRGTPVVSIGLYPNRELDHVFVDLFPALLEGLSHIVTGSRRVGFVSLWSADLAATAHEGDPRYRAYRQVMREGGLREEVIVTPEIAGTSVRLLTRETVRCYVAENGCPDAFFCFNDERAIGTLAALRDLELRVPQDVMLLGCDGIEETEYHYPPISTIQYPFEKVAQTSWEFLLNRMKHPESPLQSVTLTPELALRQSSAKCL